MSQRVNYDKVAEVYDNQPFRKKEIDQDLIAFLDKYSDKELSNLSILDIGCGTGNQLIANHTYTPSIKMIGLDLFSGMLKQAKKKSDDIYWLQADAAKIPLKDESVDFITSQFSFHHIQDKISSIFEFFRILSSNGRFVITNICPREMPNWVYYHYFPASKDRDYKDFMPKEDIKKIMIEAGFQNITIELTYNEHKEDIHQFLEIVRERYSCSEIMAISDEDYYAGIKMLETEINNLENLDNEKIPIQLGNVIIKIKGEKL